MVASSKGGAGSWLRCALFNFTMFAWTILIMLVLWPTILISRDAMRWSARLWASGVRELLAGLVGLRHQVRGEEHLPAGPVVLAAKHQSAWDTMVFYLLFDGPVYVLKKELLAVPIAGWYLRRVGMVAVDRRGGASALKAMIAGVEAALADGRAVVIFPEGTRTAPGESRPYHPGVAALYSRLTVPVVPVALNSGLFWPRRAFLKNPGTITLEFLPPIPAGLVRRAFTAELERRIEDACARLAADNPQAGESGPRH